MRLVERKYNEALDAMTGAQRLERAFALYDAVHEMLALQVRQAEPSLTDRQVQVRVARLMYLSDARVQRMLDRVESGNA